MSGRIAKTVLWLLLAVAASAQAQTVEYVHTDALGSVVAVTDANRNVLERREYEPYGRQLTPAVSNGPGYTGHVQDAATGLVYMQQRYYDAQIGVFLSVDPVTAYDNPITQFHRYRYANNNPYKFTDPSGKSATCTASSCQIVCESIAECAGDYIYVAGVYVSRLIESAMNSTGDKSDDGKSEEKPESKSDNKQPGEGTQNVDKPGEAQEEIGRAQEQSRKNRPSVQEGDWEGAKKRPKARDIESTRKSDDRAQHDRERNWQDHLDDYDDYFDEDYFDEDVGR